MFEFLRSTNHQSHRNTLIEFSKGVNVLFGISLHGKTALARAIKLITDNRPLGCKYYSNFAPDKGETEIQLKAEDTPLVTLRKIVRRRPNKEKVLENTIYKFGDEEFSGGDKSVPDEIKNAFNLTELNIQRQFDRPFLILSSAGEFARMINRVTKLDKVDDWVSEFRKRINKTKNEVELLESQMKASEIEMGRYAGFEDLEKEVLALQKISGEVESLDSQCIRLDKILTKIETTEEELKKIRPALSIEADIKELIAIENTIILLVQQTALIDKAKAIDIRAKELQLLLANLKRLEVIIEQEQEAIRLKSFISRIEQINKTIESLKMDYNKNKEEYMKLLKGTKECPIFQSPCPVVNEMSERVEKEL